MNKTKSEIKQLKDKEIQEDLSQKEKIRLSRLEHEVKHDLVELQGLDEELKHLKDLQAEKRVEKNKEKEEIFNSTYAVQPELDDEAYLNNACGAIKPTEPAERVVAFNNM